MGVLSQGDLTRAVEEYVAEMIGDILTWRRGNFRFELGDVRPIHGFERSPGELLPRIDLNTQRALLEASRILDESGGEAGEMAAPDFPEQATGSPPPGSTGQDRSGLLARNSQTVAATVGGRPGSDPTTLDELFEWPAGGPESRKRAAPDSGERPRSIQIVSSDGKLVEALRVRLDAESISLDRRSAGSVGIGLPGETSSGVLVDLRNGCSTVELPELRDCLADLPIVAIADSAASRHGAQRLGAVATVDANVDDVLDRCRELCIESPARVPVDAPPRRASALDRLRRLSSEIRSGALSANATLVLLNTLAESSQRSILFLVMSDALKAIGGFGFCSLSGRPVVETTRGLTLPLTEPNALVDAVLYEESRELRLDTDILPAAFLQRVGAPESGQAAVLPVTGTEGVILLIYTDNGSRPVEDLDLLALAADQVGVAIENEFLRQRLSRGQAPKGANGKMTTSRTGP